MNIYYDVNGSRRKELVQALSEITLWEAQYQGAPSFNFVVGNYTVTKDGTIICPDGQPREIYEKLVDNLEKKGFTATRSDLNSVVIALPRKDYDDNALARLKNLIASKQTLLKAAIGTETLEIVEKDDKLYFPWFINHSLDGEVEAYTRLIAALGRTAREQHRISASEKPQDNLKYAMRLFLVRLGFIGDEYKRTRKILLRNLSGNCSWKSGHAPERGDVLCPAEIDSEAVGLSVMSAPDFLDDAEGGWDQ